MTESKKQIGTIFRTLSEQRLMHCMWIDDSIDNMTQKKDTVQDNVHDENLTKQKRSNMQDIKVDGALANSEMSPEFIEFMEGEKTKSEDN